ncbi:NUDIX domain-containing protein [Streptomyces sp. DW26H14]|uniref:NUDIX domain-containing protein n=1 Tax=Streptomyces sp. DW26H14 TaxID=3435395 RepID=UPI00403E342D
MDTTSSEVDMTKVQTLESVGWVSYERGRLLVVRSKGRDAFYLPGGKLEPGESPEEALVREVREELGLKLHSSTLVHFATVSAPAHARPGVQLSMRCFTGVVDGVPQVDGEIAEMRWVSKGQSDLCAPAVQEVLRLLPDL